MTGIYTHIDYYTELKIEKKIYKMKKIRLGMYINFCINLRAWLLKQDKLALNEIIQDIIIDPAKVINKHKTLIANEIFKLIKKKNENITSDKINEKIEKNNKWMSKLIAIFAYYCGWKKDDVLNLFIDEIDSIIKEIVVLIVKSAEMAQDGVFLAYYYGKNFPEKYNREIVNKRNEETQNDPNEIDKLRKLNRVWLAKTYKGESNDIS